MNINSQFMIIHFAKPQNLQHELLKHLFSRINNIPTPLLEDNKKERIVNLEPNLQKIKFLPESIKS